MKSKTKITTLILLAAAALLLVCAVNAKAQDTNPPPATPENFLQTFTTWASNTDPSKPWPTNAFEIYTGARYLNNVQWANMVGFQKNIGSFDLEARLNNAGIAGIIQSVEGGVGYCLFQKNDLKLQFSILGGYDKVDQCMLIDPELCLKKMMTVNTYTGLGLDYARSLGKGQKAPQYPGVSLFVGTSF
jgi:hypothetical protein